MTASALPADDHIYVYGIARTVSDCALPLNACKGVVPGRSIELVRYRNLAAIVSAFPPEAASPKAETDENEWARSRAVAHHEVVAELANCIPLAPLKFGTVLRNFDSLGAFIEQNAAALEETLDQVSGCREWGLKLSGDPNVAREAAQSAAPVALLREELALASDGTAFFIRKRLQRAAGAEAQRMLTCHAIEAHQALDALARRSVHVRTHPSLANACGNGRVMLLNAAYLVETSCEAKFQSALDALRGSFATFGLSDRLTGPWPPYNFVSLPSGKAADV